jgi:hypothetical protein
VSVTQAAGAFANASGATSLGVTNVTIGNYRYITVTNGITGLLTNVSAGGVAKWECLYYFRDSTDSTTGDYSVWGGKVTTTGAQTISLTFSSGSGECFSSELVWSGGVANVWRVVASGMLFTSSATTFNYPSLRSAPGTDQAYVGACRVSNTAGSGGTSGFTYSSANANGDAALFNGTLAATTSYQPAATNLTAGYCVGWGVILQANPALTNRPSTPMSNAVSRAASWFKKESGFFVRDRGFLIPEAA